VRAACRLLLVDLSGVPGEQLQSSSPFSWRSRTYACGSELRVRLVDQWAEVIPLRVLPLHWSLISGLTGRKVHCRHKYIYLIRPEISRRLLADWLA